MYYIYVSTYHAYSVLGNCNVPLVDIPVTRYIYILFTDHCNTHVYYNIISDSK